MKSDKSKARHFRKMLFTGLFFLLPIGLTYWILSYLINLAQGISRPIVNQIFRALEIQKGATGVEFIITIVSLSIVLAVIAGVGWLANFYFGKKVLNFVDSIMLRVPVVRSIYGGTKQIIEAFSLQRTSGSFKKVVLLEYPRKDSWVLGFVTNENLVKANNLFGRPLIGVFVPSTPNPTTGFLLYLPAEDLHLIDINVEDAVKLIVSAGLVLPNNDRHPPVTLADDLAALGVSIPEPRGLSRRVRPSVEGPESQAHE